MKKLSSLIKPSLIASGNAGTEELAKALRAGEVRSMWASLVEEEILAHTNGVYVVHDDGRMIMHVYVDESIFAAELNNRRELIQLLCNERFGESIEEFQIHISYGLMKKRYPFKKELLPEGRRILRSLSQDEMESIEKTCLSIENDRLRECFKQAMINDLKWSDPIY